MPPETAKLLFDMKNAVERITRFVTGRTVDDYRNDDLLRSAVERQFEIIGEAMSRLLKIDQTTAEKISECRKIAGFRNVLIHGYDAIDDEISWSVIETKLPNLRLELEILLQGESSSTHG